MKSEQKTKEELKKKLKPTQSEEKQNGGKSERGILVKKNSLARVTPSIKPENMKKKQRQWLRVT